MPPWLPMALPKRPDQRVVDEGGAHGHLVHDAQVLAACIIEMNPAPAQVTIQLQRPS